MKTFRLPEGFLLGCATAATQIEGGDRNNNWYDWCIKGKIKDGSSCIRADDHWNRYAEDIELLSRLNQKVYRMGLEWSRIEPENGSFSEEAVSHYRDELRLLAAKGIKPLVTLHHFTNPLWFMREGDFETEKSVAYFERYVRYVVERLGDIASEYITINEPNVYNVYGYYYGTWPPGKKDPRLSMKVYRNMTKCHIAAYRAIHEVRERMGFKGRTMVGLAHHLRVFDPASISPLDKSAAKVMKYIFQDAVVKSMAYGSYVPPIGIGSPSGKGRFYDFIGINYYTRSNVHFNGFREDTKPGVPVNDLGWEIYPEGLGRVCREYYKKYDAPLWITENGTCDSRDAFRAKYIYSHLMVISELCDQGIPVERYYHWTFMDNFEWLEGEAARFGLVEVDYGTQKRRIRKSGEFYSEVCRNNGVTKSMLQRYGLS